MTMLPGRWVSGVVVAACLAGAFPAYGQVPDLKAADSLGVDAVARGSLRAVLRPASDVRLSSRAAGVVEVFHAREGEAVEAGAPILSLDSRQEVAEVAQAAAVVRGAEAEVERARAEFGRVDALKTEDIFSEKQHGEARTTLALAEARRDQAKAALAMAQAKLDDRTLRTPVRGVFLKTNKQVGEAVDRLETVARVVDISALEMVLYCDAAMFGQFSVGQTYPVQVDRGRAAPLQVDSTVVFVDPVVDSASATFRVRLRVDLPPAAYSGFPARLVLEGVAATASAAPRG